MIISFKHNDTDYINFDTDDTDAMALLQGQLGDTVLQKIIAATVAPASAQQIFTLKTQLTDTDYKIIKCSECQLSKQPMPYDVAVLHAERQALRDQINQLERSPLAT